MRLLQKIAPPSFSALAPRAAIGVLAAALFTLAPPPTSLPAMLPSAHAALSEGEKEVRTEGGVVYRFPPVDLTNLKSRCVFSSSAMGQANAARDSLYDLRQCPMSGKNAAGFDISGAIMADGDFSNTNFKEAQLSKAFASGAKFDDCDFSAAVIDRAYFKDASFRGAIFNNAVLSASTFEDADLENTDFTDAYIGQFDAKKICKNPTLKGENPKTGAPTKESLGCGPS